MIARAQRQKVRIPARMRAGGMPVSVCIRDISARSMLVESAASPPAGTFVEIVGPQSSIAGQVIWSKPTRFALRTRERLDVRATAAELGSLRLTGDELASSPLARPRRLADAQGGGAQHQAERSRLLGRRIEYVGLAACVALAAASIAGVTYYAMSHSLAPVAASLSAGG